MFHKLFRKKTQKVGKYGSSEYIHKDILIKAFSDVIQGKTKTKCK